MLEVLLCVDFGSVCICHCVFFFKQKTAYEMRISDWSSDVCSSDLIMATECEITMAVEQAQIRMFDLAKRKHGITRKVLNLETGIAISTLRSYEEGTSMPVSALVKMARVIPNELLSLMLDVGGKVIADAEPDPADTRTAEHTSELQSLMRIS